MVTGDGYGRRLWAYYVVLVFLISSCIFFIFLLIGDVYGRWLREKTLRGREKARETERDTSNRAFWGGKSRFGTESEREREGERVTSNQAFWGGKTPIWDREEGREREREKERHREIRQVKLFGMERHQFGTGTKGEREREREIRQIKLFGVERHQFGTERKGERERVRETQRYTSNQAFWGGETAIWDREEGRERERHREIRQIKLSGVERQQFGTERKGERERDTKKRRRKRRGKEEEKEEKGRKRIEKGEKVMRVNTFYGLTFFFLG